MLEPYEFGPLSLTPDQIAAPAFFVDKKLSARWVAPDGTDTFSQILALELASVSRGNIFDLLLRPVIKATLPDWQALFSFVYTRLRGSTARDIFDTGTVFISKAHIPDNPSKAHTIPDIHPFRVDSCTIGSGVDADEPSLRLFGLEFKSGTLFLLRQDHWLPEISGNGKQAPAVGNIKPAGEKKAICILSARLNDSHRIADTMLPEVYFKLVNRIWDEADDVVRALGGIRAGSSGAEIQYMFSENIGRNPIFSAICCAMQLNGRMRALEEQLKAEEGWADEIWLNMGISHGTDDLTASEAVGSMELMIPGGASDQSSLLSGISAKGEIWVTKHSVTQLPKKLIDRVVLGVERRGQFFRNFFTRLSELAPSVESGQPKPEMGALFIARVVKIEKQESNQRLTNEVNHVGQQPGGQGSR